MKPFLRKLFGSKSNTAARVINAPPLFSSTIHPFRKNLIKPVVLFLLLSLTFFNASAQFLVPLDTRYDGSLNFIIPNFSNLRNIIWNVYRREKVINGLKQYQYVRSLSDTNMYIAKGTKGEYFILFFEDAEHQFVQIYASGYYNLEGYYKWDHINPLKGLSTIEKEKDIGGWHCYFEKMEPGDDGRYIYAIKQHQGDTLEVSCTVVKHP